MNIQKTPQNSGHSISLIKPDRKVNGLLFT